MNNFPEFYFEGIGGCKSFNFIPITDVDEIPYTISDTLTSSVQLKSAKQWYTGMALPRTLSVVEKYNPARQTYNYVILGRARGTDSEIVSLFSDMAGRKFLIDIEDNNSNRRLIGCNDYGASFSWEHDTSETPSGRNDFKFTFEIELTEPAKIYAPTELS